LICYNFTMRLKEKLAAREISGELYIVDIEAETLHSLNLSGSFIWNCLRKGLDAGAIASRLAGEFEVKPEEALKDVKAFLKTLEDRGLVKK